jgi:hypothetical protein
VQSPMAATAPGMVFTIVTLLLSLCTSSVLAGKFTLTALHVSGFSVH